MKRAPSATARAASAIFAGMRRYGVSETLMAPSAAGGSAALRLPGSAAFPPLDQHVVRPETREEMVRGERIHAQPALAPHGDRHFSLDFVLGGHVRAGYVGSTDLLTHVLHGSDFASDTCIRRQGEDETTGERFLEELAFEVVHEQSLGKATERAEDWSHRGVRRIVGIFVKKGTVEEWMPRAKRWRALDLGSVLSDPCLVRPLSVKALLDAAVADDEVARALEAKGNPAILAMKAVSQEQGELRGEQRGEQRGARREAAAAVLAVLASRGLEVTPRVRTTVEGSEDVAQLRRWLARAVTAASADDVIDEA
jgi:hypothetical protein